MLNITFNGTKPSQREYQYSIVGNARVDVVRFVLQSDICSEFNLDDLKRYFKCYVKVQSAGGEYIDKISATSSYDGEKQTLTINFDLLKKTTQFKNISLQLQFESDEGQIVAQTEIVCLTLKGNINADKEIPDLFPSALSELDYRVGELEKGITADTYSKEQVDTKLANQKVEIENDVDEKVAELQEEIDNSHDIIVDNPNHYENENGITKIIRQRESGGNIVKSYLIDKYVEPAVSYVCEQHRENDGYDYGGEIDDFINDLGRDNFHSIFGADAYDDELVDIFSLYYDENDEITKGFLFGVKDGGIGNYGGISFFDCEPNKEITLVVGKYFYYDENGNKVFDESANLWCEQVVGNEGISTNPITQERQEIKVKTNDDGYLYFDSDNAETEATNSRFILYEIRYEKAEITTYKKREIGSGGSVDMSIGNVEIEKIWLTYDDGKSIRTDYLGNLFEEKPFVNDSTRIHINFKTTPISSKVEEEIKKGRFIIRLDYPMKSRNISLYYNSGGDVRKEISQDNYGVGVRSYCHNFKKYQSNFNRNVFKTEILKRSLIFINESDIKTNRYGEKHIHKKISLFQYIINICECPNNAFYPITNEKIQDGQELFDAFNACINETFQIGIPSLNQNGGDDYSGSLFSGSFVYKCYSKMGNFPNIQTNNGNNYRVNGKKLNPAFTCYTPLYTKTHELDIVLHSPYWNNHHNIMRYFTKINEDLGYQSDFLTMFKLENVKPNNSKRNFMVAKPRCAILSKNWENADYSFLKTFPQATQDIKLVCKAIRDVDDWGIGLMPIFRIKIGAK